MMYETMNDWYSVAKNNWKKRIVYNKYFLYIDAFYHQDPGEWLVYFVRPRLDNKDWDILHMMVLDTNQETPPKEQIEKEFEKFLLFRLYPEMLANDF